MFTSKRRKIRVSFGDLLTSLPHMNHHPFIVESPGQPTYALQEVSLALAIIYTQIRLVSPRKVETYGEKRMNDVQTLLFVVLLCHLVIHVRLSISSMSTFVD